MSTVTHTFDSLWRILVVGIAIGVGMPALFAAGVRLNVVANQNPQAVVARAGSWLCYGAVLAVVAAGILFVMKDFLAHDLGVHLF